MTNVTNSIYGKVFEQYPLFLYNTAQGLINFVTIAQSAALNLIPTINVLSGTQVISNTVTKLPLSNQTFVSNHTIRGPNRVEFELRYNITAEGRALSPFIYQATFLFLEKILINDSYLFWLLTPYKIYKNLAIETITPAKHEYNGEGVPDWVFHVSAVNLLFDTTTSEQTLGLSAKRRIDQFLKIGNTV